MRHILALLSIAVVACGPSRDNNNGTPDADTTPPDACSGLECRIVQCEKEGKPPTTLTGTVFAPNGTLALYGASVYVPASDPGPIADGVQCTRCMDDYPGGAIAAVSSEVDGSFTLTNVPAGRNVPLVIQVGKWRRRIDIPDVVPCTENQLMPDQTRLPRTKLEGDIPKIAMVAGGCDALECLLRKIGIADSEFTAEGGTGRIHIYGSNGATGTAAGAFTPATGLWASIDKLKQYDIAMFSCECGSRPTEKTQAMMNTVKEYADLGGRVFLSHYHHIWIDGEIGNPSHAPPVWPEIAVCQSNSTMSGTVLVDQVNNPKGGAFSMWLQHVMASTTPGQLTITNGRRSCTEVDTNRAERWIYQASSTELPQVFQFTTPNEAPEAERCGKVVFSDMHVSQDSSSGQFPGNCTGGTALTPQEKALAFMFFDIATCVGVIGKNQ